MGSHWVESSLLAEQQLSNTKDLCQGATEASPIVLSCLMMPAWPATALGELYQGW